MKHGRHHWHQRGGRARRAAGFTLLELFVAFTLLALFILPMMSILHKARLRSTEYSVRARVQELAQRKLFERIYSYSEDSFAGGVIQPLQGTFEAEGEPRWQWQIPYPQMMNQGEQVLLEYRIRVYAPQLSAMQGEGTPQETLNEFLGGGNASYEMTTWALPTASWYLEQEELAAQGIDPGYGGYGGLGGVGGLGGF